MTCPSASDSSESSKPISSSEQQQRKTRPSTSRSLGSSGSDSGPQTALVTGRTSTSRSANPPTGYSSGRRTHAHVPLPSRTHPNPRNQTQTLPRTAAATSTRSERPSSVMSSTQTITSESGFRAAHLEGYHRYAGTLYFPARRSAGTLIVTTNSTTTATGSSSTAATASGSISPADGDGSAADHAISSSMHDRHGYSYSQSYSHSQTIDTIYADEQQQQHQTRASTSSHQTSSTTSWSATTIAEIPASTTGTTADGDARATHSHSQQPSLNLSADANSRSPVSQYGQPSASADNAVPSGSYLPNRITPPEHGHVNYYPGPYGSASASASASASEPASASASAISGVADRVDPEPSVPPSLASYALTQSAVEASLWRDLGSAYASTTPPPPVLSSAWTPPFRALDANRSRPAHWESPSSSGSATTTTAYPPAAQPSTTLPGASPTYTCSPVSSTGTQSASWVPSSQPIVVGSSERITSRSSRPYAIQVPQRPSLTQSALFSSSSPSSSSLQVSSLAASGASSTSTAAPTPATASTTQLSRVPGPATSFSLPQYDLQSPVSPRRLSGAGDEQTMRRAEETARQTSLTAVLSPSSTFGGAQQYARHSPRYGSEPYSPDSIRPVQSSTCHEYEQARHRESTAAFQVPVQYGDGPGGRTIMESGVVAETRLSPTSSAGVVASDPSNSRGGAYSFVGTNISTYSGPPDGVSESDQSPASSFAAKSSLGGTSHLSVPGSIREAYPYNYSYTSSSTVPASLTAQATASGSRSAAGSSGGSGGQNTRKRNHPCWMCHKSFDRPSTLRKVSRPPRLNNCTRLPPSSGEIEERGFLSLMSRFKPVLRFIASFPATAKPFFSRFYNSRERWVFAIV